MKKLIFYSLLLAIVANVAMAQSGQSGCTSATTPSGDIVFLGIDYSLVRFSYIDESAAYTIRTLPEINRLFVTEAKKYDIGKLMGKSVVKTDFDYVNNVAYNLPDGQIISNEDYKINVDDVLALISKYPDSTDDGVGLVFVAENMNKKNATGSYYVTFFNLKTKEVIAACRKTGKAGGFGMRNYWAGSIYNLMKSWK